MAVRGAAICPEEAGTVDDGVGLGVGDGDGRAVIAVPAAGIVAAIGAAVTATAGEAFTADAPAASVTTGAGVVEVDEDDCVDEEPDDTGMEGRDAKKGDDEKLNKSAEADDDEVFDGANGRRT